MEISNELLINTAMNAAGFILAGALSVLIYSIATKRHREVQLINFLPEDTERDSEPQKTSRSEPRMEFVRFDNRNDEQPVVQRKEATTVSNNGRLQRNRLEVIRQAREMMDSGRATAEIRKILPLSGAELEFMQRTSISGKSRV